MRSESNRRREKRTKVCKEVHSGGQKKRIGEEEGKKSNGGKGKRWEEKRE